MTIGTVMFIMLLMLSTQSTTIAQYCIKFIVNIILYAVLCTESDWHFKIIWGYGLEYVLMMWLILRTLFYLQEFCDGTTLNH